MNDQQPTTPLPSEGFHAAQPTEQLVHETGAPQAQAQPQPQPQYQQQQYPHPYQPTKPYQQAPATATDGTAFSITSFVLGIVSVTMGGIIIAIIGLVMGLMARKRPTAQPSLTTWGIWLNAAALIIWGVMIIMMVFFFVVFFGGIVALLGELATYY